MDGTVAAAEGLGDFEDDVELLGIELRVDDPLVGLEKIEEARLLLLRERADRPSTFSGSMPASDAMFKTSSRVSPAA